MGDDLTKPLYQEDYDMDDLDGLDSLELSEEDLKVLVGEDFDGLDSEDLKVLDDFHRWDAADALELDDAKKLTRDLMLVNLGLKFEYAVSSEHVKPRQAKKFRVPLVGLPRTSFSVPAWYLETRQNMAQYSFLRDKSAIFYDDSFMFFSNEMIQLDENVRTCDYRDETKPMPIVNRRPLYVYTTLYFVARTPKSALSNSEYVIAVKDGKPHHLLLQVHLPGGVQRKKPLIVHSL